MSIGSKGPLKHCVIYDAYAIYALDGGLYLAETRYEADEMQILSCNLRELLNALDVIEGVASADCAAPNWLDRYLSGIDDTIVLPSAVKSLVDPVKDPYIHPYDIERDIQTLHLYRSMPSRIAREFGLFKRVA